MKPKRKVFHIVWRRGVNGTSGRWACKLDGKYLAVNNSTIDKETYLVAVCKLAMQSQPSQVVAHRRDGVIQFERTYPRASDPRRFKG